MNVKNKARVEGSICNAYLVEEASTFCSYYFEPHVLTKQRNVPRNDDGGDICADERNLSIFTYPGRTYGPSSSRFLEDRQIHPTHTYILLNCKEVEPYVRMYVDQVLILQHPNITDDEVSDCLDKDFTTWFHNFAITCGLFTNSYIYDLAKGPLRSVNTYPVYFVNGFKFHTKSHGRHKAIANDGVCVRGQHYSEYEDDYYGRLEEILELEYVGLPIKRTILFKCEWLIED